MYELITSYLGNVSEENVKWLAEDIHNLLNGWINPNNRSKGIKFSTFKMKVGFQKNVIALAHYNSVEVNPSVFTSRSNALVALLTARFSKKKANDMLATLVLDIVAHEMSHLQQDFLKYIDGDMLSLFGKRINVHRLEQANAWRTRNWIMGNKEELEAMFGFKVDYSLVDLVNTYYKDDTQEEFFEVENPVDYVFTLLTGFGLSDLNQQAIDKLNIKKVGVIIDGDFYNLYDPDQMYNVDRKIKYSWKKFDVTIPTIVETRSGYAIASTITHVGDLDKTDFSATEYFRYCQKPVTA